MKTIAKPWQERQCARRGFRRSVRHARLHHAYAGRGKDLRFDVKRCVSD